MRRAILGAIRCVLGSAEKRLKQWTKPSLGSMVRGALNDLPRSRRALLAENALLRQQVIVLQRQMPRPPITQLDRLALVMLARLCGNWRDALLIIKPDTLLKWHRQGFRLLWRRKSKPGPRTPRLPEETIALIKQMAVENRRWVAKRIRDELAKLTIQVSRRTVRRYMKQARQSLPPPSAG